MAYVEISKSLILAGKAAANGLWDLIRLNFADHESRIGTLETGVEDLPVGCMLNFAAEGAGKLPTGYLYCDGSAISRSTYSELFAVIGTTYGAGNGSTTFNVPDFRSRSPVGAGTGDYSGDNTNRTLGQQLGEESVTLTEAEMDQHTHATNDSGHTHEVACTNNTGSPGGTTPVKRNRNAVDTFTSSQSQTGISIANAGGGGAHENMAPFKVCEFIIRTNV